ncbi:MAG: peptidase U32 [Pirellulaceae bacterium]|nr:MAG: peptidase U32 [Pirellulaceae bacterium]
MVVKKENMSWQDRQVELLAPAGDWQCARAAIENGADAIYFGLQTGFNARARAKNFSIDELPELMLALRRQNVRGYVTLNTLVFTDELPRVEAHVRALAAAGVDAVIVQDLGVIRLIRELCPELRIHASTQMTLTDASGIDMVAQLGVARVVLARELSIRQIAAITQATNTPVEVFVHGALCVAYSGQCLTSESLGGRSANRGQCAQACRLPYELICDDVPRELGEVKYLLSPLDLAGYDHIPELIDAGVTAFKIEGRLKSPEYVASTCRQYRRAIDSALERRFTPLSEEDRRELELSFTRGFAPGWLEGCDHKRLTPGLSSAKRGTYVGQVVDQGRDALQVQLTSPLALGDGIVVEGDRFEGAEVGGRVYQLRVGKRRVRHVDQGTVWLGLQHGALDNRSESLRGRRVYKTDDPQLRKRLRATFAEPGIGRRVPIDIRVRVAANEALHLEVRTPEISWFPIETDFVPPQARKHAATAEVVQQQLGRLGGTVYRLGTVQCHVDGQAMVPLSIWGKLRRRMLEELETRRRPQAKVCVQDEVTARLCHQIAAEAALSGGESSDPTPRLRVLCRSLAQLQDVLDAGIDDVIADFHDLRQYRSAVSLAHAAGATIALATLRVHKPGEDGLFVAMRKHAADSWLARNYAALEFCRREGIPAVADFSLNVTNPISAGIVRQWGAVRVTASYDMNRDQLWELAEKLPTHWLEVVIHQHMPMFHMEHCVFCTVLSPGRNKSDCGRPCDTHSVRLRDRTGAEHPLHADIGCRNTLYNATAQSGAEAVAELLQRGLRYFRIELLQDAPREVTHRLIELYRLLLAGSISGTEVWKELRADNRIGVTRGTLEHPRNPLAIL